MFHILEHLNGDLSATLNDPEYRGFFFHLSDGSLDLYGFFSDTLRLSLMPGYHINFIPFDFTMKFCRQLPEYYPFAQLSGPFLNVSYIQLQLTGNLAVRQIQSHEI